MAAMRDRLTDVWDDLADRCRRRINRWRGRGWHACPPSTAFFNLTILAAARRVGHACPGEVIITEDNILDFADEWEDPQQLAHLRSNPYRAWCSFRRGLKHAGADPEILVGASPGRGLKALKVIVSVEAAGVRVRVSEATVTMPPLPTWP